MTREFTSNTSEFKKLLENPYRKIVHVNGETAALLFFLEEPQGKLTLWTGSKYIEFDPITFKKLPKFITRHIDLSILQEYVNSIYSGRRVPSEGLFFEDGNLIKL